MFRKHPTGIGDIVSQFLRDNGLETPLLEKRIIDAWDQIMPPTIIQQTGDKFIKNQTLMVKIKSPALRQELSMMRTELMKKLNNHIGTKVIYDLRVY